MEEFIEIEELCRRLKLNKSWVYQRTRLNKIPHVRFGKYVRFRISEVVEYFEKGVSNGEQPDVPNNTDPERRGQSNEDEPDF